MGPTIETILCLLILLVVPSGCLIAYFAARIWKTRRGGWLEGKLWFLP